MSAESENRLLEELGTLLEKQIDLAHKGSFAAVLQTAGQSGELVAKIAEARLFEKPEHKTAKERLTALYRDLQALLTTQQSAAAEQLKSLRKGKKTLSVYRGSV